MGPNLSLEYDNRELHTKQCLDFYLSEECLIRLVDGVDSILVSVKGEGDALIGSSRVSLDGVFFLGYEDQFWSLHTGTGRSGKFRLRMELSPEAAPQRPTIHLPLENLKLWVTVVGCKELSYTSKEMSPYVCLEYANRTFSTKEEDYWTDVPQYPAFGDRFVIDIAKGLYEMSVFVYNRCPLRGHYIIGRGRISIREALVQGYDNSVWELYSESGRYVGGLLLRMKLSPYSIVQVLETFSTSIEEKYGMDLIPTRQSYSTATANRRDLNLFEHLQTWPDSRPRPQSAPAFIKEGGFLFRMRTS